MTEGQWLVLDTGFGRYLGRYRKVIRNVTETLSGSCEVVLSECIRLESVNVPVPTKGGMSIGTVGVQTPVVPWRPPFDRDIEMRFPQDRVVNYIPILDDDVAGLRKELLARCGPVGHG